MSNPTDAREGRDALTAWLPDLTYAGGRFLPGLALVTNARTGRVVSLLPLAPLREALGREPRDGEAHDIPVRDARAPARFVRLRGRALLPGMANAHSHAFQRVIRGRTEWRSAARDTFWTWREQMYAAAARLTPEGLYDASRMAFLEMALSGITAVGEFHYLHHAPEGTTYEDPNLLAKQVVRAARDVGIRIALLRVAYARAGFEKQPDPRQARFITPDPAAFIKHLDDLDSQLSHADDDAKRAPATPTHDHEETRVRGTQAMAARLTGEPVARNADESVMRDADETVARDADESVAPFAWAGLAPHSVRAVPLDYLREIAAYARARRMPVHMHVSEQPAENESCLREHGRTPVRLLADEAMLDARFTAVHAVHVDASEAQALSGSNVCACPTTERNLGDGVVPADLFFDAGVRLSLGTDSHTQIDLLEDARELEYHLRLQKLSRAVLAPQDSDQHHSQLSSLAARLFECATANGARCIGSDAGTLEPGSPADFFTVALDDPSVAGAGLEDLLPSIVFSLSRTALRETAVGGRLCVEHGRHPAQEEIAARFAALQKELWE